ncbi:hypothetical protein F4803DRAFT_526831 [Xylaria telfairii]|nr:hypothetical protein F4803DRAFT_526831 [Xylaria telfairii]
MGQYFRLVCPWDKLRGGTRMKLGEFLFSHHDLDHLVQLLLVPVQPQDRPHPLPSFKTIGSGWRDHGYSSKPYKNKPSNGKSSPSTTVSSLCSLPAELHHRIFFFIPFTEDVVSLGMTNQYFWSIALQYMEDYYISSFGTWAGKKLVAVGDDVEPGDFPPGLFSAEELEAEFDAFRQLQIDVPDWRDYEEQLVPEEPFTLAHFVFEEVSEVSKPKNPVHQADRLIGACARRGIVMDPAWPSVRDKLHIESEVYWAQDEQWILRNLTTKQIVRSEAIALSPDYIEGPHIEFLGFGEVLLSRIAWSTYSDVSMSDPTNISRGVWAGHRFDIITRSKHETETGGEGWTDVSDEVKTEIADIWEKNYGPDWRDLITKQ